MTQEDEKLLLLDLSSRLTHGVKVDFFGNTEELLGILSDIVSIGYDINIYEDASVEDVKPYLRSMSDMTEEERNEFYCNLRPKYDDKSWESMGADVDWLNAHHFDYRGLIEKGLALEAPKDMYNTK